MDLNGEPIAFVKRGTAWGEYGAADQGLGHTQSMSFAFEGGNGLPVGAVESVYHIRVQKGQRDVWSTRNCA
jgi:hypothetical protein